MFHSLRLPHYFSTKINRKIDELYASTAIANFAQQVVMVFEPLFLYFVLGLSLSQVLLFFAGVYACYILFLPLGGWLASKYGYAHAILFNIPLQILFWFFLFGSQDNVSFLYIAPVLFALQKALYWPAFHASIARFADHGQLGREFSALKALINIAAILGPILGGLVSQHFGVRMLFVISSAIYTLSFVPLFLEREVFVPKLYKYADTWSLFKRFPKQLFGYWGFGEELIMGTAWPIFIYLQVGGFAATGKLVTIATLVATGTVLAVGSYIDRWKKQSLMKVSTIAYFFVWIARFGLHNSWMVKVFIAPFWGVFVVDAVSRTLKDVIFVPLSALAYERAENTHIMPYVVFFEQSLAIGKLLAALCGAVLFAVTGSWTVIFVMAAIFSLFYLLL